MGDPTKFRYLWEYYSFHAVFACLLLSELFIFFYTMQRGPCTQTAKGDHGTKWLLPDLLRYKNSSGGKGTGSAIWQGIRGL